MDSSDEPGLETQKDLGTDDKALVRRWLLELKLADKEEDDWRRDVAKLWDLYRSEDRKKNSFPILWSNTETLRPAIYNSPPKPDVRRRFKDADPLGKAVSEVLGRGLEFSIDSEDFDGQIVMDVLDMLVPGRGLSRVKYVPTFSESDDEDQLEWEQSLIEHVQWDDFRHGPGKTWKQVTWEAFRHRLTREELVTRFGAAGEKVRLDNTGDDEINNLDQGDGIAKVFKTGLVWEIWDKDEKQVIFLAPSHREAPLKVVPDPLGLQGFFPNPQPLYAIEDSQSLVPVTLYEQYKEQAEELNQVSNRINKIVSACKLRGVYDATLSELSELLRGDDNDLIPAANVAALFDRGGLKDAIWFMPVEQIAEVLQILYQQREASKQVIYEITGIADVLRGSTNPNETLGAQELKAQFGSQRLRKLQAGVQKYIRGLIRIMAEVIAEKFQLETLKAMTGLNFPTEQQNQQSILQYQQQAQLAQSQGQQPPPPPQLPPSWEQIIAVLRDDAQRTFKVDVETDSTIASSIETDMQALTQMLGGIVQLINGFGPAVQMGAIPIEALKEMILAVTRRARLGNAVEDALDKMQQPKPMGQDPSQAIQAEQKKMQDQMAIEKGKLEASNQQSQIEADKKILDLERQVFAMQQGTAEKEMAMAHESNMGQQELHTEKSISQMQSMIEAIQNKIVQFQEQQTMEAAAETAAEQEGKDSTTVSQLAAMNSQLLQSFNAMIDTLRARP